MWRELCVRIGSGSEKRDWKKVPLFEHSTTWVIRGKVLMSFYTKSINLLQKHANGFTLHQQGAVNNKGTKTGSPRTESKGWSRASVRNLRGFLQSIERLALPFHAVMFTGTFPESNYPDVAGFNSVLHRFHMELNKGDIAKWAWMDKGEYWCQPNTKGLAMSGVCWTGCVEFTKKRTPHVHYLIFFNLFDRDTGELWSPDWVEDGERYKQEPNPYIYAVRNLWLYLTMDYGTHYKAQHAKTVRDISTELLNYELKHAARGVKHYQKDMRNSPVKWLDNPSFPRVWRKSRWFPVVPSEVLGFVDSDAWYVLRRRVVKWLVNRAVSRERWQEVSYWRRYLKGYSEDRSRQKGISQLTDLDIEKLSRDLELRKENEE